MSLLFCNALRIASVSDSGTTLLLRTPTRVRSGSGGSGCGLISGKFGSWIAGVIGVGCAAGVTTCVPGGAVGGGGGGIGCWPGGEGGGVNGVGLWGLGHTATHGRVVELN